MPPVNALSMPQEEFETWLREAGKSIGGTGMGAILGISPWSDVARLWDGILGLVSDTSATGRMNRGTILEPTIATIYTAETGREMQQWPAFRMEAPYWWMRASPDRRIVAGPHTGARDGDGVCEIKCLGTNTFKETLMRGIAPHYYAQLQHYLGMTGCRWGAFAVFNAEEWRLHHFDVERNDSFIDDMWARAERFWNEYILTRQRPLVDGQPVYPSPVPCVGSSGIVRRDDAPFVGAVQALSRAVQQQKLAEHAVKQAQALIKTMMGETEKVETPVGKVYFAEQTSKRVDMEALAADIAPLGVNIDDYRRQTVTRPFKFYGRGAATEEARSETIEA